MFSLCDLHPPFFKRNFQSGGMLLNIDQFDMAKYPYFVDGSCKQILEKNVKGFAIGLALKTLK